MALRQHLRLHVLSCALLLLAGTFPGVSAQDPFDCKVSIDDNKWDLTSLAGEVIVSRELNSPPSKFRDTVTFNLCEDLKRQDGVAEKDQVSTSDLIEHRSEVDVYSILRGFFSARRTQEHV